MKRLVTYMMLTLVLAACSTTRSLHEGEYRLARNKVVVTNDPTYNVADLQPYIKQKPGSWTPMLYVYNWTSGKGTKWDHFVEKIGTPPVVFDSTQVVASVSSMLNHLEYTGHYNASISPVTHISGRNASVEYDVTMGNGYIIDSIDFQVPNRPIAEKIAADSTEFTIAKGDILSQQALEVESERLASLLRNDGYYGFTKNYFFFYADTNKVSGHCDLTVKLEDYTRNESASAARPHRQFYFGDISISPQRGFKVRQKFLENLCTIKEGDLYREQDVNTTYNRFTSVPVFSSVQMQMTEADSTTVDCRINISPSKLQSVKFNLEGSYNSSSLFGISPSITYGHKNIFGGGEVLTLGLRGNFQFRPKDPARSTEFAVSAGLKIPQFLPLPNRKFKNTIPSTLINFSFNYQNRPEYTRNIFALEYGYTWTNNNKLYYKLSPLRANVVKIYNMKEDFRILIRDPYVLNSYTNHFDLGGSASLYYTTDSSIKPEHTYFYLRWQNDFSGNMLSLFNKTMKVSESGQHLIWGVPYSQFVKSELSLVETFRFGKNDKSALAVRLLAGAGLAYGNSKSLPFEHLFYAGGSSSLRGWQSRSVGPGSAPIDSAFTINNQTGDMHLEANVEYRFPVVWKLEGGLFVDAGNVWNIGKSSNDGEVDERSIFHFSNFLKTSALNWGVGLRLDFGLLLVRLDMGMKTYDPVRQSWLGPGKWFRSDGFALCFGVGYPF